MTIFDVCHLVNYNDTKFVLGEITNCARIKNNIVRACEADSKSVYKRVLSDENFDTRHAEFGGDLVCPVAKPCIITIFNMETIAEELLAHNANKKHDGEGADDKDNYVCEKFASCAGRLFDRCSDRERSVGSGGEVVDGGGGEYYEEDGTDNDS